MVEMTSGMEESGGKFPPLLVKSGGIRTKREEEKKREKGKKREK